MLIVMLAKIFTLFTLSQNVGAVVGLQGIEGVRPWGHCQAL